MKEKVYIVTDRDGNFANTHFYTDQKHAMSIAASIGGGIAETFVRDPKEQMKHIASMDMYGLNWEVTPTRTQRSKMARLILKMFNLEDAL